MAKEEKVKINRYKLQRREEKNILREANAELSVEPKQLDIIKSRLAIYIAKGLDLDDAIKLIGCRKEQLNRLRGDPQFEQFIQAAIANNEAEYLTVIENNAKLAQQWQAAAWFLERRFPDKYGKRDIIRHEYQLKLQTFMKIIMNVINEANPQLRVKIVTQLREYNFDGTDLADHSFKPQLEAPEVVEAYAVDEEDGD